MCIILMPRIRPEVFHMVKTSATPAAEAKAAVGQKRDVSMMRCVCRT